MSLIGRTVRGASLVFLICGGWIASAFAQANLPGCTLERVAGTSRQVLHCQGGLTITVEGGARYRLTDRNSDGTADGVVLRRKALLIDAPSGQAGGFTVVTPQAIAAVRGTRWAIDVASGKTSVFVARGSVDVRRPNRNGAVVLGPGEGVDVERGDAPLTVRRWGAARVAALMARFGL
jgi:ferric-dicitrate binding protein FerR (iron transport regulator)